MVCDLSDLYLLTDRHGATRSVPSTPYRKWLDGEECRRTKKPDYLDTHQIGRLVIVKLPFHTIPSHSDSLSRSAYNTLHELARVLQPPTKTIHTLTPSQKHYISDVTNGIHYSSIHLPHSTTAYTAQSYTVIKQGTPMDFCI
jgi:hypothetical protein